MSMSKDTSHYPSDFHSTTHFCIQLETWRARKLVSATVVFFFSTIHKFSCRLQETVSLVLVSHTNGFEWHVSFLMLSLSEYLNTHASLGVPKVSCNTHGLQFQEKTKSLTCFWWVCLWRKNTGNYLEPSDFQLHFKKHIASLKQI